MRGELGPLTAQLTMEESQLDSILSLFLGPLPGSSILQSQPK